MKECNKCRKTKEYSEYYKNKDGKDGYQSVCKKCNTEQSLKRRQEIKEEVFSYKLEKGCIDCGYNDNAAALEFDHLPEYKKIDTVNNLMKKMNYQKIWDEIGKCEVVCANCHRIRTAKRRI